MEGGAARRYAGDRELARAAESLAARLPAPLAPFARLAFNYRWSWARSGHELFRAVDAHRFAVCGENPVRLLQEAPVRSLSRAARDTQLVARAQVLNRILEEELAGQAEGPVVPDRPVAFLCAECAIHVSLPTYAGGLGVLAGDLLKEASDRALPMVAVSILYRQGSFRQRLDASGWQHEYWIDTDPERLPAALVTNGAGEPLTIRVPIDEHDVVAQIWRVNAGRVPLYLLDTERPENARIDRWIGARLYVGDRATRLAQYALLGIGGIRALRALGIEPGTVHLNEGHAALAPVELVREALAAGAPWEEALAQARSRVVFTTHTPVAAGNDEYTEEELLPTLRAYLKSFGDAAPRVLDLGRRHGKPGEPVGLTPLALRLSRYANGVSRRHGEVARSMWAELWPGTPPQRVPIDHVTNGVHLATWMGPSLRRLLSRHLGDDFERRAEDPALWARLDEIPDEELWAVRGELRAELVEYVRDRSVADRLARGMTSRAYVEAAARYFDHGVLTVGFARRLATYKRLHLLSHDPERAIRLLEGDRPMQIVIAGKAHPSDDDGKRLVQQLFPIASTEVARRVAYVEDYDLDVAEQLVRGCDVWVNLPRAPLEACGTSGMKAALNGGLHLSVLDGWWAEAFDGSNGWGIASDPGLDPARQDDRDADALYHFLESEVVPLFYERDEAGIPRGWLRRIRASLRSLAPRFGATRMLREYAEKAYRS
jgi:glycogen phosphorylase